MNARRHLALLRCQAASERGVSMIQFALVFPILLLFILAIFDFGRVLAVKAMLTKGAENGLNIAMKIPNLDVDINGLPPSDIEYQRYLFARQMVIDTAAQLPLNTFVTASTNPSGATLIPYVYNDPGIGPSTAQVAVIRPGEQVEMGAAGSGKWVAHKTFPPRAGGVTPSQPQVNLLRREPVYIELRARIQTFLPFVESIDIVGSAQGMREVVPAGVMASFGGPDSGTTTTIPGSTTTTTINYTGTTTTTLATSCIPNWAGCFTNPFVTFQGPKCPKLDSTATYCTCDTCSAIAGMRLGEQ